MNSHNLRYLLSLVYRATDIAWEENARLKMDFVGNSENVAQLGRFLIIRKNQRKLKSDQLTDNNLRRWYLLIIKPVTFAS